jgi:hypothetical protein
VRLASSAAGVDVVKVVEAHPSSAAAHPSASASASAAAAAALHCSLHHLLLVLMW